MCHVSGHKCKSVFLGFNSHSLPKLVTRKHHPPDVHVGVGENHVRARAGDTGKRVKFEERQSHIKIEEDSNWTNGITLGDGIV